MRKVFDLLSYRDRSISRARLVIQIRTYSSLRTCPNHGATSAKKKRENLENIRDDIKDSYFD